MKSRQGYFVECDAALCVFLEDKNQQLSDEEKFIDHRIDERRLFLKRIDGLEKRLQKWVHEWHDSNHFAEEDLLLQLQQQQQS
ncbi:MAG: hypothetical protein MHM6MM_007056 [Cercozoa sp. M6MM]